ncbi:hypothetical protein D5274_10755 [bacterium 1XD42-94]|nr:hypothetical protein [bacterium 1XD42-76]NBK05613.1 hypothetical protein [bacterium 1XD42-94]
MALCSIPDKSGRRQVRNHLFSARLMPCNGTEYSALPAGPAQTDLNCYSTLLMKVRRRQAA